jgi:phenylacetate-CoA ligase
VINPASGEPVGPGEEGELVFTTLTRQAMPVIRYRTRDIARLDDSPCPCGRTGVRMSRVKGRTDDMLIIRGVNVYPSQIEQALLRVEGVLPQYQIVIDRQKSLDEVTVRVEIRPEVFSDEMRQMQMLRQRIAHEIASIANIRADIELVEPQSLERSQGKAKRVIDKRQLAE